MPLPSFNMEDILNLSPAYRYKAVADDRREGSPKPRILVVHSSITTKLPDDSMSYPGTFGSRDPKPDRNSTTCEYSVIKRTSDVVSRSKNPRICCDSLNTCRSGGEMYEDRSDCLRLDLSRPGVASRGVIGETIQSNYNMKRRRLRTVFNDKQLAALEDRFASQKYLSTPDREVVAKGLGLTQMQVKTWYQNRRMRWKKAVIAGDCSDELTDSLRKGKGRPKDTVKIDHSPSIGDANLSTQEKGS